MLAFHDTNVLTSGGISTSGTVLDRTDPSKCALNSSFRIQSATLVITDANGNELYNKTAFQGASNSQARRRAMPGYVPMWMNEFFGDYGANLTAGATYYFTLSGTTFPGVTSVMIDNQSFTYTPAS